MLEPETKSEIAAMVRSGFYDKTQLLEIFTEEMYAPGELDTDEVAAAIDSNFAEFELDKKTWPQVTDCDRLDAAFDALNERGVIALQNAGYTQSDGYDDINEAYAEHPDQDSVLGYCYYHGQDLERAISGGGLFFSFGPVDPAEEQTKGVEVGNLIREEFERVGLTVNWDGTFENRLRIPNIVWQKR